MGEASSKILKQFVENLENDVLSQAGDDASLTAAESPTGSPTGSPVESGAAPDAPASSAATTAPPTSTSAPATLRRIDSPEAKPLDLLDAAGGSVAKRMLPIASLVAVVIIVLGLRRRK